MNIDQEIEIVLNRMIGNSVKPMNDEEYDVCSFVAQEVSESRPYILMNKDTDINNACCGAVGLFDIYEDTKLTDILMRKIADTTFMMLPIKDDSMTITSFTTAIDTTSCDDVENFSLKYVGFPQKLDFLSPIYLGHEFHHCLKDINQQEYQYMLRYADVIPLFFEIICAENLISPLKKAVYSNRLGMLSISKDFLKKHFERDGDSLFLSFNDSKACQYLNSFYYAICLYNEYKCKPNRVLKDIKRVLFGEFTTFDLLERYNLLSREHDDEVKDYIKVFQKI